MRIATWNLENFFAPGTSDSAPRSSAAYTSKVVSLAATITAVAPDVIAVQEVGAPPVLDDLVAALGGAWHTAVADPDGRGIRVGLLSRTALGEIEQVKDFPAGLGPVQVDDVGQTLTALRRPALKATVTLEGRDMHVISAHLKSKLLTFPGNRFSTDDEDERARYAVYALHRRAAEAAGIRAYVTSLLDDTSPGGLPAVVVAGDLNDDGQAATTQIFYGPPGSEIGTGGFNRPDAGDSRRLWTLDALIPEPNRYSRIYRGRHELIDHILVSAPLAQTVTTVEIGPGASPSITDDHDTRRNEPGSDHRPAHAQFGSQPGCTDLRAE